MRYRFTLLLPPLLLLTFTTLLCADSALISGTLQPNLTLKTIADAQLLYLTPTNREATVDLTKVNNLNLEAVPQLLQAEQAFTAKDYKKSLTLYRTALQQTDDPTLQILIKTRQLRTLDTPENFPEALKLFFELFQHSPTANTFTLHPQHLPPANSALLTEAINVLNKKQSDPAFKSPALQKQLNFWLLEMYQQNNDPRAAALAQFLAAQAPLEFTGSPAIELPTNAPSNFAPPSPPQITTTLQQIESLYAARQYPETIHAADLALRTIPGTPAQRLFTLKAQSLQALGQPTQAALAYFSIYAYYAQTSPHDATEALKQATKLLPPTHQPK